MKGRRLVVAWIAAMAGPAMAQPPAAQTWLFDVRLDGKLIGTHRFEVEGPAERRHVTSTARLDVRLLGITLYRYRHESAERWVGDCPEEIRSRTDDDGTQQDVQWRQPDPGPSGTGAGVSGCLMSYAYWHPALVSQQRLVNPQTGVVDALKVERMPDGVVQVGAREVAAQRWRLTITPAPAPLAAAASGLAARPSSSGAAPQRIDLWRDRDNGRWIGLDAVAKGGRMLTYRLP